MEYLLRQYRAAILAGNEDSENHYYTKILKYTVGMEIVIRDCRDQGLAAVKQHCNPDNIAPGVAPSPDEEE